MRLPKPEKLPSGNWRVRLQVGKERKSFTAPMKKEALEKAKKFYAGIETEKRILLGVEQETVIFCSQVLHLL